MFADVIISWRLTIINFSLISNSDYLEKLLQEQTPDKVELKKVCYKLIELSQKALQFIPRKYLQTAEFSAFQLNSMKEDVEKHKYEILSIAKKITNAILLYNIG